MGWLTRILGRERSSGAVRLRPESVLAVLMLLDAEAPEPEGDGVELVMRAFVGRNRELFEALMRRDLWPQIKIATGRLGPGEGADPAALAALVERGHGSEAGALVQLVRRSLRAGDEERELVLLTVHGARDAEGLPTDLRPLDGAIAPRLDLTDPVAARAR